MAEARVASCGFLPPFKFATLLDKTPTLQTATVLATR
jgi:hypothetical protein